MAPQVPAPDVPPYLVPYYNAAEVSGSGFATLCWTTEKEQQLRFEAISKLYDFHGATLVDAGCGRADLLDHLVGKNTIPRKYVGIESVPELVDYARTHHPSSTIIQSDFVLSGFQTDEPPDVIVFSGSLNTFRRMTLKRVIHSALATCKEAVIFNFLCTREKAGPAWLAWHTKKDIEDLLDGLVTTVSFTEGYIPGDATAIAKPLTSKC